jgi:hypothetical protein
MWCESRHRVMDITRWRKIGENVPFRGVGMTSRGHGSSVLAECKARFPQMQERAHE